jgi:predicted lipoprotein with Yx(FWY)xxD motif
MRRILVVLFAAMLVAAACGGDDEEPTGAGGQEQAAEENATIAVENTDLGDVLVDAEGRTLYMFVPDQQNNGTPTCYEDCEQAWPAFEANGDQVAGDGVDESLLGTVERKDGTQQVTFDGLPLYYFSGDQAAGDVNGQGLGSVWWTMAGDGSLVQEGNPIVETTSSDFGDILVDNQGNTLYMFVPDQQKNGKPTCYGDCAQAWPPYEAEAGVIAGDGLDQKLLGVAERRDGTQQVTYGGLPLYRFSGDEQAGQTNGQGLDDVWWVMDTSGKPVEQQP